MSEQAPTKELVRRAVISECGRYRYRLYREWAKSERMPVLWVMLNPSTADASIDDPTIRRCMAFSKAWGYGAMWVGNIFAIRSTDPSILADVGAEQARGPDNSRHVLAMCHESALVVCAWGVHGGTHIPSFLQCPGGLWHLGLTKGRAPRHPLYVKGSTELRAFT